MNQLQLFKPKTFPQELFGNEYMTLEPYRLLNDKTSAPIEFVLKEKKSTLICERLYYESNVKL